MKNILVVSLFFSIVVNAQWLQQNSGTTENLKSVFFINANEGWACGENGIMIKTTDGGNSWEIQNSNSDAALSTIQFIDSNIGWACGEDEFIKTTNGGNTWSLSTWPTSNYLVRFKFFDSNNGWAVSNHAIAFSYVYHTTNGDNTWEIKYQTSSDIYDAMDFINDSAGIVIGYFNLLKTTNGGSNWNFYPSVFSGTPMCLEFINEQAGFLSHNTLGSAQISKTTNGGETWTQPYSNNTKFIHSIDFLTVETGYAVGFKMQVPPNPNLDFVMITTNGGVSWHEQYSNTGVLNSVFFVNDNLGWAVGNGGKIIHTINGGTPVELISFTVNLDGNNLILNWSTASEINNGGFEIERSTNKNDWLRIGFKEGRGTTTEQQNYSYTDDVNGINVPELYYRLKQIDFDGSYEYSDIVEVTVAPIKFSLSQNYPNPFNPITKIIWQSPVGSHQTLKVYDVLGREVATLVDEYRDAGSYEVEFDGSQLASGVYYYQLKVGYHSSNSVQGYFESKKMMIIK